MSAANITTALRKIEPVYVMIDGKLTLDAPVSVAWPHAIAYTTWQEYSKAEHVSGVVGGEGELVRLKKEEGGIEYPPYYARTIKLEPERRIIWKTFPVRNKPDDLEFFGIVKFVLENVGGKTLFNYELIYEFLIPHQDTSELEAARALWYHNINHSNSFIFPKLKRLVETGTV
jgi:hypothetical protein